MDIQLIQLMTPMVLSGGGLLAMANARNSDIATRSRDCSKKIRKARERLKSAKSKWLRRRLKGFVRNQKWQRREFNIRYRLLSASSILFLIGITFLLLLIIVVSMTKVDTTAIIFTEMSVFSYILGLILLAYEFIAGHSTLEKEGESN